MKDIDVSLKATLDKLIHSGVISERDDLYSFPHPSLGSKEVGKALVRLTERHGVLVDSEALILAVVPPFLFYNGPSDLATVKQIVEFAGELLQWTQ
jgi:hypothetical protein